MEELRERLARVRCSTLLVVGSESALAELGEMMAMANPRARLVKLPHSGQWAPLENPDAFREVVRGFLTGS